MAWNKDLPIPTTPIISIPSVHKSNWLAIESAFEVEHIFIDDNNRGKHRRGKVRAVFLGTTSQINSLSPTEGALAINTETGEKLCYDKGTWINMGDLLRTNVSVTMTGSDSSVSSGGILVPFNSVNIDSLGEFNTSTYKFSPKEDGVFFIETRLLIVSPVGGVYVQPRIRLYNSDSEFSDALANTVVPSANKLVAFNSVVLPVTKNQKVGIYLTHNKSYSIILKADASTSLSIKRVS